MLCLVLGHLRFWFTNSVTIYKGNGISVTPMGWFCIRCGKTKSYS